MIYEFECLTDEGGCGSQFEISCQMSEISGLKPKCPSCNKKKAVFRNFGTIIVSVPKTLGSRMDKNSTKMSDDHKEHLTRKHNEYRNQPFSGKLPDGCKTYDKDSSGKRIPKPS